MTLTSEDSHLHHYHIQSYQGDIKIWSDPFTPEYTSCQPGALFYKDPAWIKLADGGSCNDVAGDSCVSGRSLTSRRTAASHSFWAFQAGTLVDSYNR